MAAEWRSPLAAGAVIDGFRVEALLHEGGMARLWQVSHPAHAALPLVMKVPRVEGGEEPATIVGFEVERMIMPLLDGPHVPRFVAQGDFTRQPYIVMERIPGPTLRPRLEAAPIPLSELVEIGERVALALHHLHRQHVVHLDVKPSNILFRDDGSAVLVDYGLSRHDHLPDLLAEEFRLPLGTGPYMSPEQVRHVRSDARSDLFALGVMLYHLLTGERPFGAPQTLRGVRQRLWRDPVPPRALREDCPPWLQEVVLRCLEVQPEQRYQSAAQLALDLQVPQQVPLTERAGRSERAGRLQRARRWLDAPAASPGSAAAQSAGHAVLMAAVDVAGASAELQERLREATRRLLLAEPGARLACVSVMRTGRIAMDQLTDAEGRSVHVQQLSALQHWAQPLAQDAALGAARLTCHVLEASDPAGALIDFARRTGVDHIVMGARASSRARRYLGSVSSQVVAEAECSVTVVRV